MPGAKKLRFENWISGALLLIASISLSILIGFRDVSVGTDTANYVQFYTDALACDCFPHTFEPGLEVTARLLSLTGAGAPVFFVCLSFLQFALAWIAAKGYSRALVEGSDSLKMQLLIFASFLASPFFLSGQINIIRQGTSALFVILASRAWIDKKIFNYVVLSLLAISFHLSGAMIVLLVPLLSVGKRKLILLTSVLVCLYLAGVMEAFINVASNVLGVPVYEFVASYGEGAEYRAGVRYDFALFSLVIGVFFHLISRMQRWKNFSQLDMIFLLYLVCLIPFWIFGWASYADRYAFVAWQFLPLLAGVSAFAMLKKLSAGVGGLIALAASVFFVFRGGLF